MKKFTTALLGLSLLLTSCGGNSDKPAAAAEQKRTRSYTKSEGLHLLLEGLLFMESLHQMQVN